MLDELFGEWWVGICKPSSYVRTSFNAVFSFQAIFVYLYIPIATAEIDYIYLSRTASLLGYLITMLLLKFPFTQPTTECLLRKRPRAPQLPVFTVKQLS